LNNKSYKSSILSKLFKTLAIKSDKICYMSLVSESHPKYKMLDSQLSCRTKVHSVYNFKI